MVVEPSKLYSQQVPATFKVTMASLGSNKELEASSNGNTKSQRTSLIFNLDNKEDFTLCSLTNDKVEQQALDLVLTEGETIAFRVEGPHVIHLSGYYINDDEDENDGFINDEDEDEIFSDEAEEDSQIEYDSEEDYDSEDDEDSEEEEDSDLETRNHPRISFVETSEEEIDSEEEISEDESSEEEVQKKSSKKVKFDLDEAKKVKETPKEQAKTAATPVKVTPNPAKPASPVAAPVEAAKTASPQITKEQGPTPVKKTLPSGLQIEDLKLGNGQKVSNGKKVLIHYKGTLSNGKVFDSSFGGKPLKFAVGKGEVIKGMDIGVVGMAIGGSRKLVIPGPLAYGNQALPNIPRNSTLIFEIRLEKIL